MELQNHKFHESKDVVFDENIFLFVKVESSIPLTLTLTSITTTRRKVGLPNKEGQLESSG